MTPKIDVLIVTDKGQTIAWKEPGLAATGCDFRTLGFLPRCTRTHSLFGWGYCQPHNGCGATITRIPSPTMRRRFGDLLDE